MLAGFLTLDFAFKTVFYKQKNCFSAKAFGFWKEFQCVVHLPVSLLLWQSFGQMRKQTRSQINICRFLIIQRHTNDSFISIQKITNKPVVSDNQWHQIIRRLQVLLMSHWKIWDESGEDVVKECGGLSRSSCKPNGCLLKQFFFRSAQGMIVIRLFLLQICSHRLMQHICLCYHLGFLGDKWRQQRFKPAGDRRCNCFHGKLS